MEIQEESLTGEIGQVHEEKDTQETEKILDEVIKQTKKVNLFLEQQEKEEKKHPRQEILNDPASPFLEQQTMEKEKNGDSVQENEKLGMDTNSVQPPIKMEKKKTSKISKKIKKLKLEVRELELRNEKLKEKNRKLKVQRA